jgi:hypothetical protein
VEIYQGERINRSPKINGYESMILISMKLPLLLINSYGRISAAGQ